MALKINHYRIFCNLFSLPRRENDGTEADYYWIFCNLPLFLGEGMMVLKPTIIGLPAIYPLSPWERARERAKPNNLKKRRLKKMATQTRITQTTKRKT